MFEENRHKKLPFKSALIWILLATILVSGTIIMGYLYYRYSFEQRMHDEAYNILSIQQHTDGHSQLPTEYIAEILGLSSDRPTNIYQFPINDSKERLLKCPMIRMCQIKRKAPSSLFVHYQLRKPLFNLSDYTNTLIDEEGLIFPNHPFYPNLTVPKLVLGLTETAIQWGTKISGKNFKLAIELLQYISYYPQMTLLQIDVSKAYTPSYGTREIVLTIEHQSQKHILRCSTRNYRKELEHYLTIRKTLPPQNSFFDLRIPEIVFFKGKLPINK